MEPQRPHAVVTAQARTVSRQGSPEHSGPVQTGSVTSSTKCLLRKETHMSFRNWLLAGTSITLLALAPIGAVRAQDANNADVKAAFAAYQSDQSDANKQALEQACINAGFKGLDDCIAALTGTAPVDQQPAATASSAEAPAAAPASSAEPPPAPEPSSEAPPPPSAQNETPPAPPSSSEAAPAATATSEAAPP